MGILVRLSVIAFISIFITYFLLLTISIPAYAHSSVQVIKLVPNNFEPSEVTVDENSTLIFDNQDSLPRWPASDFHPTHDLYPEFDPKQAIQPGESWSFKPKKTGTWKYHDHLNPHIRGAITVLPDKQTQNAKNPAIKPNILQSVKNFFTSAINKLRSLFTPKADGIKKEIENTEAFRKLAPEEQFQALTDFAKAYGADKAWSYIAKNFEKEAGSTGNIHDLAHLVGKLLYEGKGIEGISICTPTFAFGCYHGLLDAAFHTSLNDLPRAEKACEKVGLVNSGPYGSCIHGIGHGVASFHQSKDIENALLDCNRLGNGRGFCYDGVFMEFVRSAAPSFFSKDKPFYPCDTLENKYGDTYSLSCGRNQPTVFVSRLGMEFADAVGMCSKNTLGGKFKSSCFDALGFMLASSQNAQKIIIGCKSITNPAYLALCLKSAAGELVFQNVPGWQEKSKEVCTASPPVSRASCHENLERLIKEYGRGEEQFNMLQDEQKGDGYVRAQMKICYQTGSKDDCYRKVAELFSKQFALKKILALFSANEQYPEIYSRCHEVTHYLSRNEYKKTGSVAKVYAQCDSTCHGGCYHGVLEQYIKDKNLALGALRLEFPKVCGKIEDFATPLVFNECQHGLGHAAMFVTEMEVPNSLSLCDTLDSQNGQERCWSGVFMENSSSSTNNDHPGKYIKADDLLYPCNWLNQKYAKLCYRYQSSYFALITNHNWTETANLCLKVPESYQDECFRTIGTNQVGFTQDTNRMRKNCGLMPTSHFQETCLQGIVSSFSYRFVGDGRRMENFCAGVGKEFQQACFKQIGVSVVDWAKDTKEAIAWCDKINNSQFSSWCKSSIN